MLNTLRSYLIFSKAVIQVQENTHEHIFIIWPATAMSKSSSLECEIIGKSGSDTTGNVNKHKNQVQNIVFINVGDSGLFNWESEMSACWCLPCVYASQLVCYTCLEMMLHFGNHFHKCSSQMHETKPWKAQKHRFYSQESRIVQTRPSVFSEEFFCYFGKGHLHEGSLPNFWKNLPICGQAMAKMHTCRNFPNHITFKDMYPP